jgi:hypothetical protein
MIVLIYLYYQFTGLAGGLARALYRPSVILRQYLTLAAEVLPWTN